MMDSNSAGNPIAKRIREAIMELQQTNRRTITPVNTNQEKVVKSIRTLSRSRVSSILRELRSSSGYSYDELTEKSGFPKQLLFDVEYKDRRLTLDQLRILADCYGVTINDILGIDIE